MKRLNTVSVLIVGFLAANSAFQSSVQAQNEMPQGRTGGGGSNQAAGPSGQHPGQVGAVPAEKAAVFDFQLANLGLLPPTDADKARLPHLSDMLRHLLAASGKYDVVPITPEVKTDVDKASELRSCGGCAVDFAKKLGAKLAVTGEIQKVSNLILNINIYMKEVDSDKPEQAYSVDIRGDNDLSFDHGIKYIVKHNILKE